MAGDFISKEVRDVVSPDWIKECEEFCDKQIEGSTPRSASADMWDENASDLVLKIRQLMAENTRLAAWELVAEEQIAALVGRLDNPELAERLVSKAIPLHQRITMFFECYRQVRAQLEEALYDRDHAESKLDDTEKLLRQANSGMIDTAKENGELENWLQEVCDSVSIDHKYGCIDAAKRYLKSLRDRRGFIDGAKEQKQGEA